jgi:hypothetical protein
MIAFRIYHFRYALIRRLRSCWYLLGAIEIRGTGRGKKLDGNTSTDELPLSVGPALMESRPLLADLEAFLSILSRFQN